MRTEGTLVRSAPDGRRGARALLVATVTALICAALTLLLAPAANADNQGGGGGGGTPSRQTVVDIVYTVEFNQVGTKYYGEWFGSYPTYIDWRTDACSVPGWVTFLSPKAKAYSNFFRPSCVLHDFGYRNYGHVHQLSMTRATKNLVDRRLLLNMEAQCTRYSGYARADCDAAAGDFYEAVQHFGDSSFFG